MREGIGNTNLSGVLDEHRRLVVVNGEPWSRRPWPVPLSPYPLLWLTRPRKEMLCLIAALLHAYCAALCREQRQHSAGRHCPSAQGRSGRVAGGPQVTLPPLPGVWWVARCCTLFSSLPAAVSLLLS